MPGGINDGQRLMPGGINDGHTQRVFHDAHMNDHSHDYKQMWEKAENELKKRDEFARMLENKLDKLNQLYHDVLRNGCRENPLREYKSWVDMFN